MYLLKLTCINLYKGLKSNKIVFRDLGAIYQTHYNSTTSVLSMCNDIKLQKYVLCKYVFYFYVEEMNLIYTISSRR